LQPVDRLHALDAVRAFALLLGVVLHAVAANLEGFPIPLWREEPHTLAAVIYYVIHMFRMSAFFLIAGLFARMVLERRGMRAFLSDRARRIAVPLFLFGPFVLVSITLGFAFGALPHGLDYLQSLAAKAQSATGDAAPAEGSGILAHMWFLYYLLIFYGIALAIRSLMSTIDPRDSIVKACDHVVAFLMRGVWGPLFISIPIAFYLWKNATWSEWLGLPAPSWLVPDSTAIIGYGVPFALGWLLHRQVQRLLDLQRSWFTYFVLAVGLTIVSISIIGTTPLWRGPNLEGTERLIYTVAYVTGLWCWVFAVVGAAVRYLSNAHPVTRYLADASYWIYLMHLTTIIFIITLLRPYDWHWGIKFMITVLGSMPILLVSYHYLVRYSWIGAILNGRRYPRPRQAPPADPAPVPS